MAPAARAARAQAGKKQSAISTFGRVTKSAAAPTSSKASFNKAVPAVREAAPAKSSVRAGKRRRHDDSDNEQDYAGEGRMSQLFAKKPKTQSPLSDTTSPAFFSNQPSPVSSQTLYSATDPPIGASYDVSFAKPVTVASLPSTLRNILTLHESFLKALSIHYAHNGQSTPAELGSLMKTTTCLWKKHPVNKEDIQRMLALYEISSEQAPVFQPGRTISHDVSPFQLTSSGPLGNMRICVEYIGAPGSPKEMARGAMRSPFSEKNLQCLFELDLVCLFRASHNDSNTHLAFLLGPIADFPLLACSIGNQSAMRQEKASIHRKEILQLSAQSQQRQQKPKIIRVESSNGAGIEVDATLAVRSRTQSLFDRIAAKQALAASSSAPSVAAIQRHHAVGRIGEVVEILRMKQQQKSIGRNHFLSDVNTTSPPKATGQRVSFSMKQLQSEIRDSVGVPIGDGEVRLCLRILAEESPGGWMRIVESGVGDRKTSFVVLEGAGMVGRDVQKMLEERKL